MKQVLLNLAPLKRMHFKDHFFYWILPFFASLLLLLMFCFGTHGMVEFVSPQVNREYGALENIQVIMLLIAIGFAAKSTYRTVATIDKVIFCIATVTLIFMLLEEIDYGLHFYDLIFQVPPGERAVIRNVHANGTWKTILMKDMIYTFIIVVCIILPIIRGNWIPRFIRKFLPSIKIILTAVALQVISSIASQFVYSLNLHANASLDENVAEFGEGIIYYLLLIYMVELYRKTKRPVSVSRYIAGRMHATEKIHV